MEAYQDTLSRAIDEFFPLKKVMRKNNDLPWINGKVLKQIEARKRLFWQEGGKRTDAWKEAKRGTERLVKERKVGYMQTQNDHVLAKDANRNFSAMLSSSAGWSGRKNLISDNCLKRRRTKK